MIDVTRRYSMMCENWFYAWQYFLIKFEENDTRELSEWNSLNFGLLSLQAWEPTGLMITVLTITNIWVWYWCESKRNIMGNVEPSLLLLLTLKIDRLLDKETKIRILTPQTSLNWCEIFKALRKKKASSVNRMPFGWCLFDFSILHAWPESTFMMGSTNTLSYLQKLHCIIWWYNPGTLEVFIESPHLQARSGFSYL